MTICRDLSPVRRASPRHSELAGAGAEQPYIPAITIKRHLGRDELWVTEAAFDYSRDGSPPWHICEVQECNDGKIVRIDAYFGPPFEAAEWRAQWVERS